MRVVSSQNGMLANEHLERLFPPNVIIECRAIVGTHGELFSSERSSVARAVPQRQNEFTTGRACARAALARLGIPSQPIPMGESGEPVFPSTTVGSITHDCGMSVCAVGPATELRAIGVDLTENAVLDPILRSTVATKREAKSFGDASAYRCDPYRLAFSAKESLYKAIRPIVRRFVDMREVSLMMDPIGLRWRPVSAWSDLTELCYEPIEGRMYVDDKVIVTAAWIARRRARANGL